MIGHLGSRVSALLDGQLGEAETERAWAHVHQCPACRDLIEREGWVKTRLAGLSFGTASAPAHLKGALRAPELGVPPGDVYLALAGHDAGRSRRTVGLAALSGGAVGAAVVGVLVLGSAPADAPSIDRRAPANVTQVTPTPTPSPGPSGRVERDQR